MNKISKLITIAKLRELKIKLNLLQARDIKIIKYPTKALVNNFKSHRIIDRQINQHRII